MSQQELRVDVEGGKYTVVQDHNGELKALRYGQPWRNLSGDKFVLCLAYELDEAREALKKARSALLINVDKINNASKGG